MSLVEEFVNAPSVELLDHCTKDQLVKLAEHFEIELTDKRLKENIKLVLKKKLMEEGILSADDLVKPSVSCSVETPTGLTFEQQKQLLMLKFEHETRMQHKQLELEHYKLDLIKAGKLLGEGGVQEKPVFNVANNLKLLPKFTEHDPDLFFSLFERVADAKEWSDEEQTLLLQCVLTGKALEAYASLTVADSKEYRNVKSAVLQAYELVPEAYRQRFRNLRKREDQTHAEFVRDLVVQFNRWCFSSGVKSFEELCELITLEQFKNCVPDYIATYINERKVTTPQSAAVLADEYTLTHKTTFVSADLKRQPRFYERTKESLGVHRESTSSRPEFSAWKKRDSNSTCNYCQRPGHWKNECPALKSKAKFSSSAKIKPAALAAPIAKLAQSEVKTDCHNNSFGPVVKSEERGDYSAFISDGVVSLPGQKDVAVKILRDTGALHSFVRETILPFSPESNSGECILMRGMGMTIVPVPVHKLKLTCGLVSGEVEVGVRPALPVEGVDFILGNDLAGNKVWATSTPHFVVTQAPVVLPQKEVDQKAKSEPDDLFPACAVTRSMSREKKETAQQPKTETTVVLPVPLQTISKTELVQAQKSDPSLKILFESVSPTADMESAAQGYFVHADVLVRKWCAQGEDLVGKPVVQIVVPLKFREVVMKAAHDNLAGHTGVKKTYHRILCHFFWPRLKKDVAAFIQSCHTCQLTGKPNQKISPAPLRPIPALDQPFDYLIMDCVGPLPSAKSGSQYLLTLMCQATRYPAAFPLRSITTKAVLKALSQFISVFGIPRVIQTDQGSNFRSKLFSQVLQQLQVKHNQASAYHPQSQGALERFHQTLKSMLRAYCTELGRDWEEGLPWLLLAAREVVQVSTGFSPNELVFGHSVRGPLAVLHNGYQPSEPPHNLVDYVNGFKQRLFMAGKMAKLKLKESQKKMKSVFDQKARQRQFSPGDQVMCLLPVVGSPFQARFSGPGTVKRKVSEQDYLISLPKGRTRLCHINLLKPYYARRSESPDSDEIPAVKTALCANTGVFSPTELLGGEEEWPTEGVLQARLNNSEALKALPSTLSHLDEDKRSELICLINAYPTLFSDIPSQTHLIEHDIDVGEAQPIRQRFYRVSPDKRVQLDNEVEYMLQNKIAEPSNSSWASPCLLVKKPDSTLRPCTDYRKLNSVTKPDLFPLPRMEDCVDQVGSAKYTSKFDLLKGYWQVPLSPRAQEISAFITPTGLYSYKVMPFGLRNAPATFQRLMNRVVAGLTGCAVYLDDVVIFSNTWEDHLLRVRALFDRLVWANLTVNLSKCEFARATVTYLGKVVGQGEVRPVEAKVVAVQNFPPPATKKELMRFLGMVGYYRSFCKNFSSVVAPLTDLLKDKVKFVWSDKAQCAFENVKSLLCCSPVLAAPQFDQPFVLHVDASYVGAGAVLLQADKKGVERPVGFYSKKFNTYQLNYSVIEKEALALVWGLQHFDVYVGTGAPLVVYTDHNPLTFLRSLQNPNQRLMRWALFLQPYSLDIRHLKGSENVMADALSRAF